MVAAQQDSPKPVKKAKPKAAQAVPEEPVVRPPEQFVVQEREQFISVEEFRKKLNAGPPEGLYPEDAELFSYTPNSTGETIWFPMAFEQPDAVWLWEMYEKPFHVQSWEWMKWAKIPRLMQRKAVELMRDNPDEYLDMFDQWFKAMSGGLAKPGES
jgi:hypothetical protein